MRSVVRVAAYVPRSSAGGRRVGAADEDTFTLGATALERAWADRDRSPEPVPVHLLGEFPPIATWGFGAVLGRDAEIVRHAGDAGELAATLRTLEAEEGGPAVIVAAELPERSGVPAASTPSAVGAASVAYLLDASATAKPLAVAGGAGVSAVAAALAHGAPSPRGSRVPDFVGDWGVPTDHGLPVDADRVRRAAERDTTAVSEGAYVPRAEYLQNLPSRWRFIAEECDSCHEITFPARGACRRCRRKDALAPLQLPRDGGRVVAITTIGEGGQPTEFDAQVASTGPYSVAVVELGEGIRITLQVTDTTPGELKVGDAVNTLLRRLYPMEGEWRYGRKAVPVRPR